MNASELFVQCLKNENIDAIYGIPGEENIDLMDALRDSGIEFVLTRHEQAAAFMADVYGRLTGKAGVCLATLGPGACNLITGVADANMDRAPLVAIAGQADTGRMHKESHQHLDLVNALRADLEVQHVQVREPEIIPEIDPQGVQDRRSRRSPASQLHRPAGEHRGHGRSRPSRR